MKTVKVTTVASPTSISRFRGSQRGRRTPRLITDVIPTKLSKKVKALKVPTTLLRKTKLREAAHRAHSGPLHAKVRIGLPMKKARIKNKRQPSKRPQPVVRPTTGDQTIPIRLALEPMSRDSTPMSIVAAVLMSHLTCSRSTKRHRRSLKTLGPALASKSCTTRPVATVMKDITARPRGFRQTAVPQVAMSLLQATMAMLVTAV